MGRQVSLTDHCLLCIKDVMNKNAGAGNAKQVYERNPGGGFLRVALICDDCLQLLRGGNWPTDVYRKLSEDHRVEGQRAVEALVAA